MFFALSNNIYPPESYCFELLTIEFDGTIILNDCKMYPGNLVKNDKGSSKPASIPLILLHSA